MKKYLFSALALPLLFACSSEDFDEKVISNDQFAGIEKVNATFTMDEGPITRMDKGTGWTLANGDLYGFAWLTDDHTETTPYTPKVTITGNAFQNHNLIQTNGRFEPQTSIYVGKYYIYRPYDETTTAPAPINFNSLKEQTLTEGQASGYGTNEVTPWKKLAETAIIIGDKWTEILPDGHKYGDETVWDQPGIGKPYKVFAAIFSNQTGLDLKYEKNNPTFTADKEISGATDIKHTFKAGTAVGAADIYKAEVTLTGSANSFTYAPTVEPNNETYPKTVDGKTVYHNGDFWADKKNLAAVSAGDPGDGFKFAASDVITLNSPDADEDGVLDGISTGNNGSKGWFWFNSLPVTAGNGALTTVVTPVLETSYGTVTVKKSYSPDVDYTVGDCAYVLDKYNASATSVEWIKLAGADNSTTSPKTWDLAGTHNTFINQYGNHKGKYALTVDFSKGVMDGMHIKDDRHLQKLLKYYIASGKTENVNLKLDKGADGNFKLSKISIALIQTIDAEGHHVRIGACGDAAHKPSKIIITQDGQKALGLGNATEVPALNNVFAAGTNVYLAAKNSDGTDIAWTWSGGADGKTKLKSSSMVKSITNEGTLTVNATNVQVAGTTTLEKAAGATMNITQVTTVKSPLTNLGTINVGSETIKTAELRAYDVEITNDATALDACGVINNYGVVGVSETGGTTGKFNNYGIIDMKDADAMTLLTTNELTSNFDEHFDASTNKMGKVVLPEGNPTAIVSVNNADANGFIEYTWPAETSTYVTPAGNVKYNTIVVSGNIEFTGIETEIQYIEFNGTKTQVVNPGGLLKNLKGVIVNAGKSIIIEKGNKLVPMNGSFLGAGATVYLGGTFTHNAKVVSGTTVSNYFGNWSTDQIVKY